MWGRSKQGGKPCNPIPELKANSFKYNDDTFLRIPFEDYNRSVTMLRPNINCQGIRDLVAIIIINSHEKKLQNLKESNVDSVLQESIVNSFIYSI